MNSATVPLQGKLKDAMIAQQHGLKIPKTYPDFNSLRTAVLNGGNVIVRSEHPSELEGISGVNRSFTITPRCISDDFGFEIWDGFRNWSDSDLYTNLRKGQENQGHIRDFVSANNLDLSQYHALMNYSFWEYVKGYNLYVIADPVVRKRYRIFASWSNSVEPSDVTAGSGAYICCNVDRDYLPIEADRPIDNFLSSQIKNILDEYEKVRTIYGKEHCWVVEFQLNYDGDIFFLQRSPGKDFKICNWEFGPHNNNDHIIITPGYGHREVVGSTPIDGIDVSFLLGTLSKHYGREPVVSGLLDTQVRHKVVAEQNLIAEKLAFISRSELTHGENISDRHCTIIPLIRSPLYLYISDIMYELECRGFKRPAQSSETPVIINCNIRSNGKEARITFT